MAAEWSALDEETNFIIAADPNYKFDFQWLVSTLASGFMIFGGVIPYVPQYREIKRLENADGFSTLVCLALLCANCLRILFWFGKRFEMPLLIQSIVMIFAMFAMIELCVRIKFNNNLMPQKAQTFVEPKAGTSASTSRQPSPVEVPPGSPTGSSRRLSRPIFQSQTFLDLKIRHFWQWTDFISYIECTAAFTVIMGILMYFLIDNAYFVETLGYLSLTTEAMLASPQLVKNFRSKSTTGMSNTMVLMWTGGDLFKTGYFILKQVPKQFWLCGCLQVTIDILILCQIGLYKTSIYRKVAKEEPENDHQH